MKQLIYYIKILHDNIGNSLIVLLQKTKKNKKQQQQNKQTNKHNTDVYVTELCPQSYIQVGLPFFKIFFTHFDFWQCYQILLIFAPNFNLYCSFFMIPYHFCVILAQNLYSIMPGSCSLLLTTYYAQNSASKIQNA